MRQKCKCDIVQGVHGINLALMRGTSDTPLATGTSRRRKIGREKRERYTEEKRDFVVAFIRDPSDSLRSATPVCRIGAKYRALRDLEEELER